MEIGNVIRKYRKERNLTQEEMANLLGVTAPAVNKWEKGNSMPDVTLLAPIARLLNITLDTLLSFHRELTDAEIRELINEVNTSIQEKGFDEAFQLAKEKLWLYPDCEQLTLRIAQNLYAHMAINDKDNQEKYFSFILDCFLRSLKSENEDIRTSAADSLFGFYMRKEEYDKAEQYLEYFPKQSMVRRLKQAEICEKTNRIEKAYKLYEEILFSGFQIMEAAFNGIYVLAAGEENIEKSHIVMEKSRALASVFDMGKYYETSIGLDLAVKERDIDKTVEIMKTMLESVDELCAYCDSPLYEHIKLKRPKKEFYDSFRKTLADNFRDKEAYGFLQEDARYGDMFI